jgi:tetratricopeptide (TPR) repeat protein
VFVLCLAGQVVVQAATNLPATPPPPAPDPVTPREFFNAGTKLLEDRKFKQAERMLDVAVAAQIEALQPPALYNLGHVRYQLGLEDLKKGPQAKPTAAAGGAALQAGEEATRIADAALNTTEMQRLVAAYINGRGARKGLNASITAVRKAIETFGNVLNKWQRASGDFKSALELNPKDSEARHNAEVVDRSIALVVDSLREMQSLANALGDQKKELGEKMKQLKGRIPEENMPPGAAGEEEEEEPTPEGEKGKEEGPAREGQEMSLSPEQAGWLLDAFRLDKDRKLPMGDGPREADPDKRNRPTW